MNGAHRILGAYSDPLGQANATPRPLGTPPPQATLTDRLQVSHQTLAEIQTMLDAIETRLGIEPAMLQPSNMQGTAASLPPVNILAQELLERLEATARRVRQVANSL